MKRFISYNLSLIAFIILLFSPMILFGQDAGLIVEKGNGVQNNQGGIAIFGTPTGSHMAIDGDDVQSKANGTDYNRLDLNFYGGDVRICNDVLHVDYANDRLGVNTSSPDGPVDIDFGATGSLIAGTPVGAGPGWIYYAPNSNRWNGYAASGGFSIQAHFNNNGLYFNNDGKLGINKAGPGKMIDIDAGTPSNNEGLRVLHTSGNGAALLANNATLGGWFVTDGGPNYAPIWASSFNPISDRRMKKEVNTIEKADYQKYLKYIDDLETSTFYYKNESDRKNPHIGIIAQTAPPELISYAPKDPDGSDQQILTVSLADWAGLNTVVIKYLREENIRIQRELEELRTKLITLYSQVQALERN